MREHERPGWWSVPEAPLIEITEKLVEVLPADPKDDRRRIAVRWLCELATSVHAWNKSFIDFLKKYPGFRQAKTQREYKSFFTELLVYDHQLDDRHEEVKRSLCAPLKKLHARFPEDFGWLKLADEEKYDWLYRRVTDAYRNETGIIGSAQLVIRYLFEWTPPDNSWIDPEKSVNMPDFLKWQIAHFAEKVDIIKDYERDSLEQTRKLFDISEEAQIELSPIEEMDADRRGAPMTAAPRIRTTTTTTRTPQQNHPFLYNLLAFGFGVIFVAALLVIAVVIPNPTLFQVRVFTAVLAVALAGAATVITGILNVRAKLGTQFVIGASGALAVFVVVYLINPAVLK